MRNSGFKIDTQESFYSLAPEAVFDRPGKDDFVIYSERKWQSDVDANNSNATARK